MKSNKIKAFSMTGITAATLGAVLFFAFTPFAFGAVMTDKDDYAQGETVTISGNGYTPGEVVEILVLAPYGSEYDEVTTDGSGAFLWQFTLPNDNSAIGSYSYTVTGKDSGIIQSGTFTDGNVKVFPLPTTATFSLTKTIYDGFTCTGTIISGPTVVNGVSDPSGHTTGVGNTESVKLQAAAFSDQGGAFSAWTTSEPFVATSTTVVAGDTLCVVGSFTGNRDYFANYGAPPTTLTLQKTVIKDNGGTAVDTNWILSAAGPTPISGVEGDASITNAVVNPGAYILSESTGPLGYSASGWVCVGATFQLGPIVLISAGDEVTCTITNDDNPPSLTLVKKVVSDNGGTATTTDWTLTATGPTGFSGFGPSVTNADIDAGTYDLSENGPAGYSASDWVCVGGDQTDGDTIEIGLGETVTCTITNDDDPPSLTLVKVVDGGTATPADWTLTATGPTGFSGFGPSVTNADIDAGTYDLSENGPSGYSASAWVCDGGNQTDDDTVVIGLGESVICTITNTVVPEEPPSCPCGCSNEHEVGETGYGSPYIKKNGISISVRNSGCIENTTTSSASTGGNKAGGSRGGRGGRGREVEAEAGSGGGEANGNNGGAVAGNGGSGGSGGPGGFIESGPARSTGTTTNRLNFTRIRFDFIGGVNSN